MTTYNYRIVKGVGGNTKRQWTTGKPYTEIRGTQYQRAYSMEELKSLYKACKNMLMEEGQYNFLMENDISRTVINKVNKERGI
tara:strand:- start:28 stop:276 length:249 start_codon:yes stop_codon:yes gene_type:complete